MALEYEYSEDWTLSAEQPGYRFKTLEHQYGTVNIYRPILTPEEASKREKEVMDALVPIMMAYGRRKDEKKARDLEEIK